jgi:hypothetical protein
VAWVFLLPFSAQGQEEFRAKGDSIEMQVNGESKICQLDVAPLFAVKSFNEQAVIVSDRGYLSVESLQNCRKDVPIRVSLIPDGVGYLADINISKKIYVALDFVSTRPFLYLATVAHIGSKKNLLTVDGSYIRGRNVSALKVHAFSASGEPGSAAISPDGRFVAPNSQILCTADAQPGVWDVLRNRRVVTNDDACVALFSTAGTSQDSGSK